MDRFWFALNTSLWILIMLAFASLAHGQATRTWVSGTGDDSNPCSRPSPCKTFAGAISKTVTGGEVDALDPGGFGAVTITKSITIDGSGTLSGILASQATGITINIAEGSLDPDRTVRLRGLTINGTGHGRYGILVLGARKVSIEDVVIDGFDLNAIDIAAGQIQVFVQDTTIRNNKGSGIYVRTQAGVAGSVFISNVTVIFNGTALTGPKGSIISAQNNVFYGNAKEGDAPSPAGSGVALKRRVTYGNRKEANHPFAFPSVNPPPRPEVITSDIPPAPKDFTIKDFDALSADKQEAYLSSDGPLLPPSFDMNDIPMRVFVGGNWPLLVAYSLTKGTAVLTIAAENVKPFSHVLPAGENKQTVIMIPAEFGDRPRVAKLSIKTQGGVGARGSPSFTLQALGVAEDYNKDGSPGRSNPEVIGLERDNHHSVLPLLPPELPISSIIAQPNLIRIARGDKVAYKFFSKSEYTSGAAEFFSFVLTSRGIVPTRVSSTPYQHINANELTPERKWDGKNQRGEISLGVHRLEVRTWRGLKSGGQWFGPYYGPKVTVQK